MGTVRPASCCRHSRFCTFEIDIHQIGGFSVTWGLSLVVINKSIETLAMVHQWKQLGLSAVAGKPVFALSQRTLIVLGRLTLMDLKLAFRSFP